MTELELSRAEGGDGGAVQNRPDPRTPSDPVGRHGELGTASEAAGCGYPHFWSHTQI